MIRGSGLKYRVATDPAFMLVSHRSIGCRSIAIPQKSSTDISSRKMRDSSSSSERLLRPRRHDAANSGDRELKPLMKKGEAGTTLFLSHKDLEGRIGNRFSGP